MTFMIEDWIEQNIDSSIKHTGSGREIHICCPFCGDHRYRLYVELDKGLVYCHNCNFKGTVVNLIQRVEGISYTRAMGIFMDVKGNMSIPLDIRESLEHKLLIGSSGFQVNKRPIPLPDEYQLLTHSKQILAHRAIKYLQSRSITLSQIERYNMGFCAMGEYAGRIIIPIYESNKLKFWISRAIGNTQRLKEKSPSNEQYQYGKSEVIFNIDTAARNYHTAIISEGIFDALSWGGMGVSLLGKELYDEQFRVLMNYRELLYDGIYIAVDSDAASRADIMAQRLSEFFKVYIINIPDQYDDPNNFLQTHSKSALYNLVNTAQRYEEFTILRRRLDRL